MTDFTAWIKENIENLEDAYWAKQTLETETGYPPFSFERLDDNRILLKQSDLTPLAITSQKAYAHFIRMLNQIFAPDCDIDTKYNFERDVNKPD